ncbi:hypothetical protein DM860_015042 [Cuscuta australis]|uniref:Uncharacterized protein n=1 Tax=Cuscuta australis TaxID=267555 RepID=A0A328DXY2_9ASTE|nr:hypothetical protein DM860_015042 [Cuscuta australis]
MRGWRGGWKEAGYMWRLSSLVQEDQPNSSRYLGPLVKGMGVSISIGIKDFDFHVSEFNITITESMKGTSRFLSITRPTAFWLAESSIHPPLARDRWVISTFKPLILIRARTPSYAVYHSSARSSSYTIYQCIMPKKVRMY